MAGSGGTISDFLPIPDTLATVTEPDKTEAAQTLAEEPTMSHALAVADHDEKGHAQESHECSGSALENAQNGEIIFLVKT